MVNETEATSPVIEYCKAHLRGLDGVELTFAAQIRINMCPIVWCLGLHFCLAFLRVRAGSWVRAKPASSL